jgi:hypothetical protein
MAVDVQPAAPPLLLPTFSFTDSSDDLGPLTAPSSSETLTSTCSERERKRKQSQPRRSPQRAGAEMITKDNAGIGMLLDCFIT